MPPNTQPNSQSGGQPQSQFSQFPPKITPNPAPVNVVPPTPVTQPKPPVAPIPTINVKPEGNGRHLILRAAFLIIGLVVVVGLGYYFMSGKNFGENNFTSENVKVKNSLTNALALMPADLYIERNNISQFSVVDYTDRGLTLSEISFTSPVQIEELFAKYGKYMETNGFTIVNKTISTKQMSYRAVKGKDELTVMITPQNNLSFVLISYSTTDGLKNSETLSSDFPSFVPVEAENLLRSTMFSGDDGTNTFLVSFISKKSAQENYKIYDNLLNSNGFTDQHRATTTPSIALDGIRNGGHFYIVIEPRNSGSIVNMQLQVKK